MAAAASDFEPWLIQKLKALKIDEGVYGSYITGILEGDESVDEKNEALEGILSEIVVSFYINLALLTMLFLLQIQTFLTFFIQFIGERC